MQSCVKCPFLFRDIEGRHRDMFEIGWECLVSCDGNEGSKIGQIVQTVED